MFFCACSFGPPRSLAQCPMPRRPSAEASSEGLRTASLLGVTLATWAQPLPVPQIGARTRKRDNLHAQFYSANMPATGCRWQGPRGPRRTPCYIYLQLQLAHL